MAATLVSNGLSIAYQTAGDPKAPAILLVMGLGMQLTSWPQDFVDGLVEQGFYVIRFDNRDAGLSTKLDQFGSPNLPFAFIKSLFHLPIRSAYTLEDMAYDALGVLDGLGINQAHIIGASMGGMIAQIMAAKMPERVLSLTSIMSTSGRRGLPGPTAKARNVLLSRPSNPRDIDSVIDHAVKTFQVFGSPAYPTPVKVLRERLGASIRRSSCPAGVARQMVAIAATGSRVRLLKTITAPTLVIHGAADPLVPLACGVDTAAHIPGARLEVIEGMGHDLPPALIERLLALIDAHTHGKMSADPIPHHLASL